MSDGRCRLCTTNDVDGLAEEMAEAMWEATRDHTIDPPWLDAGAHWHSRYKIHAQAFIRVLRARRA